MALSWTKYWTAADDGTVFKGSDLRTIQDDISQQCVFLTTAPTTDGIIYWTGTAYASTLTLPLSVSVAASQLTNLVFWEDELISWEDELIYIS